MIKFDSKPCFARKDSTGVMLLSLRANVSPIDSDEMSVPIGTGEHRGSGRLDSLTRVRTHVSLLEISAGNVSGPRPVIRTHLPQRKEAGVGAESPMRNEGYSCPSRG
jgi:hypothetical protein